MKRRHQAGNITIFFSILLSILLPLTGILVDLARYRLAYGQVREALRLTADSLLAGYDRPLREEYGLFSMAISDRAKLEEKASGLLSANLTPLMLEGVSDIYGFKVMSLQAIPLQNLSESAVLEQQVAEFMKYRAPMQMASGLLEKLKAFSGAAGETAVIQADMEIDRELAAIRCDLVHLSLLLVKMETIGSEPGTGVTNLREKLERDMKTRTGAVREITDRYRRQADAMNLLLPELRASSARCASASAAAAQAEKAADSADAEAKKAETSWMESKGKAAEKEKSAELLAAATAEANARRLTAIMLRQDAEASSTGLERMRTAQWKPLFEQAAAELENASAMLAGNLSDILQLEAHLRRHRTYLEKGMELTASLESKLTVIAAKSKESGGAAESAGGKIGSTAGVLKASLAKKTAMPDAASVKAMDAKLNAALGTVIEWTSAAAALKTSAASLLRDAERTGAGFMAASSDPLTGKGIVPYLDASPDTSDVDNPAWTSLSRLSGISEMEGDGVMVLPDCVANPFPAEAEREEFREWFAEWSGEVADADGNGNQEETAAEKKEAKKTMSALRNSAGETARNIQAGNIDIIEAVIAFTTEEAQRLPTGPEGKLDSAAALLEIGKALLPSETYLAYSLPLEDMKSGDTKINEKTANFFTRGLDRVSETARQLGTAMSGAPETFMKSLYLNEYILSAFKNWTTPDDGIPQEIGWGRNPDKTVFSKGETEYVLFGSPVESENLAAMKRSLFATRLAMNLLHVYTTPAKGSATLALATTLAGWTVFGIPVVQNFLMISWAAAESCIDLDKLCKGEEVPIVKTSSSWYLDPGSVKEELVNKLLLDPARQKVSKLIGNGLNSAEEAVQETIGGWIDAGVDEVFAPLEVKCLDFGEAASDVVLSETAEMPKAITDTVSLLVGQLPVPEPAGQLMEGFEGILSLWMDTLRKTCAETVKLESTRQVAALREMVKSEIRNSLFKSLFYSALVTQARETATELTDAGFDAIGRQADNLFGEGTGMRGLKAGIAGRMMTMDYSEYAAMYLLLVPETLKTSRVADLMQLNLERMAPDVRMPMKQRNTAVYLRTEVAMDFWFLPDKWMKKTGFGLIQAEWGQGY